MRRSTMPLLLVLALAASACTGAARPVKESAQEVSADGGPSVTLPDGTTDTTAAGAVVGPDGAVSLPGAVPNTPGATTAGTTGATGPGGSAGGGAVSTAPTRTRLFNDKEDVIGITKTSITLCAHAALTYGAAFNTSADDLNVYWSAINQKGGIYGRQVRVTYENDNYSPDTAVQAAETCKSKNPFLLLGGIGFDQIPAVRNWAEQNRMLYMHHTATVNGSEGKQFSFAPLPTTERMGEAFAQLAIARFRDKKIGIIKRASPNWEPGVEAFKRLADRAGLKIVAERSVQNAQGNYTQDIIELRNAGAEVVWGWENALSSYQIVRQAKNQGYSPTWMLFPFNLTSQTLGQDAMNPKMVGIAMFSAYSRGDYSGPFAAYADDIKEFEAQYREHRPSADLGGFAGDLLFLNWTAQKALARLFVLCGPDCTRNRFIDVLTTYKERPFPAACETDFTRGNNRLGSTAVNIMETYQAADGKVNWRHTDSCVEKL